MVIVKLHLLTSPMKVNSNTNNDIYNMNGYSLSVSYIESISDIFMKKLSNVKFIILAIFILNKQFPL
jgi:hypothetical protein